MSLEHNLFIHTNTFSTLTKPYNFWHMCDVISSTQRSTLLVFFSFELPAKVADSSVIAYRLCGFIWVGDCNFSSRIIFNDYIFNIWHFHISFLLCSYSCVPKNSWMENQSSPIEALHRPRPLE